MCVYVQINLHKKNFHRNWIKESTHIQTSTSTIYSLIKTCCCSPIKDYPILNAMTC